MPGKAKIIYAIQDLKNKHGFGCTKIAAKFGDNLFNHLEKIFNPFGKKKVSKEKSELLKD